MNGNWKERCLLMRRQKGEKNVSSSFPRMLELWVQWITFLCVSSVIFTYSRTNSQNHCHKIRVNGYYLWGTLKWLNVVINLRDSSYNCSSVKPSDAEAVSEARNKKWRPTQEHALFIIFQIHLTGHSWR